MGAKIASTFYHKGVVTKMDTVILNNGVEMPMIGIGTSMLDEEACERTVREALEMGYRFVDTAQSYRNEGAVGRAVRQSGVKRKDVFIATKLTIANTTYEKAKESCKRSLDRLGVSAIDLLLLQYPYNDVFGAWRALTELREEGLVHAIGVCNFAADRLADLVLHVKERPQVAQFERHPYYQRPQLMEYLRRQDIQPLARGPFAGCKTDLLKNPTVCAIASAHGKRRARCSCAGRHCATSPLYRRPLGATSSLKTSPALILNSAPMSAPRWTPSNAMRAPCRQI